MGSRQYCLLLTLAVAVNYLDCDNDVGGAPESHRDVMKATSSRSQWTNCQQQLTDDIESCLSGYERLLLSSRALDKRPRDLQQPVVRRLCRQYYETLQCLHASLLQCSADESHLYVIASRVGHLRTFMVQTCAAVSSTSSFSTVAAADRRPPEVTSHRGYDVISDVGGHVTLPTTPSAKLTAVTRQSAGGGGESSNCDGSTHHVPRSQSLRSCAATSTTTSSVSLMSVFFGLLLLLRRDVILHIRRL